jgi:hypothetical protein
MLINKHLATNTAHNSYNTPSKKVYPYSVYIRMLLLYISFASVFVIMPYMMLISPV